jgi:enamine deaminase RidA (YjgF/YER057c/UK114 family)
MTFRFNRIANGSAAIAPVMTAHATLRYQARITIKRLSLLIDLLAVRSQLRHKARRSSALAGMHCRSSTNMMIKHLLLLLIALIVPMTALAQDTKRIPLPPSQNPTNADLPIAAAVWVGDILYVSGWLDPELKTHPDTKSQTEGLIRDIQKLLESQKLTLGDVVMMRVYLGADSAKGGKMDFEGMMAGYSQFFGTKEQPNKPARTTVQVVLPAGERGALVEVDVIAARPKSQLVSRLFRTTSSARFMLVTNKVASEGAFGDRDWTSAQNQIGGLV